MRRYKQDKPHDRRLQFAARCVCAIVACCAGLREQCANAFVRAGDSVWEVSSRTLSENPAAGSVEQLRIHRVDDNHWIVASLDDLLQNHLEAISPEATTRTILYVHGNWTEAGDARQRGLAVYRALSKKQCGAFRFIIYSWPSQRERGFARDAIGKKTRLDADSYYLSSLIERFDPSTRFSLLGFSFGAPVICGALHLATGSELAGRRMAAGPCDRPPMRISFVAPAFDRNALSAHGKYSTAFHDVDRVVNLYNSVDPVLKRFRFFDRQTTPVAAGFAGLLGTQFSGKLQQETLHTDPMVVQYDCGRYIGRTHDELAYYQKCPAFHRALENLLGN